MLTSSGQVTVTVTEVDPVLETTGSFLTVTITTGTGGGGGGAVDSVNGHVGVVVLDADDLADGTTNHVFTAADDTKLAGIATGATANDTDANLKARANHTGTQAIATVTGLQTALDGKETAGAAAAAQAASQPLDSDLTAIAALSTTSYGRAFLALADAAAGRTALGLGTAATQASTAFDTAGAAAAAQAASQPLDSDLTAIAALSTTSTGRSLLAGADAAALRTILALGTAATVNTGASSGDIPLLSTGGVLPIARLATGTPDGTKYVRDDGTLVTPTSGSAWTKNLDQSFASSMSDLTALTGTWAISGGVLTQTDTTTSSTRRARSTAKFDTALIAIQVECRMLSGSGTNQRMGIIPRYNGSATADYAFAYIENNSSTWKYNVDQDATLARGSVTGTGAYNTWRTLLVQFSGEGLSMWVDGTLAGTFVDVEAAAVTGLNPYFCLASYAASVEWRNLKVWNLPIPT